MASQPPNKSKASSRWGSLLSGAVAGLESRLDTILGEDNEASARSRIVDQAAASQDKPPTLAVQRTSSDASRSASRSRVNDRLQERLAKAVASQASSRASTPLNQPASPRSSLGERQSTDISRAISEKKQDTEPTTPVLNAPVLDVPTTVDDTSAQLVVESPVPETTSESAVADLPPTLLTSSLPINPAQQPDLIQDSLPSEADHDTPAEEPEALPAPLSDEPEHVSELKAELMQLRIENDAAEKQRQEDMLANLERIDALQAKLQYLAKETIAAVKEAKSSGQLTSSEQKLAEKDERIALLMQEGEKLGKVEMRQGAVIKKLRAKSLQDEKATAELRKRLVKLEESELDLRQKLKRMEQAEKHSAEQLKRFSNIEKDLETRKSELASANATVSVLREELAQAEARADEAEAKAKETVVHIDSRNLSAIQEQLEDARLEKKLADERWNTELRRVNEESQRQQQQASFRETELTNEISVSSCHEEMQTDMQSTHMRHRTSKADWRLCVCVQKKHLQTSVATHKQNCFDRSKHCKHSIRWQQKTGGPLKAH
jgi:hypothetical protein